MRQKALAVLIYGLLTTSCGSDEKTTALPQTTQEQPDENPESTGEETYQTFYVQSEKDMGTCNNQKLSHLIYVKRSKAFFTCDGKDWSEVDVPTEQVAAEVDENIWEDGISGKTWHLVGKKVGYAGPNTCSELGLNFPMIDDLSELVANGGWAYFYERANGTFIDAYGSVIKNGTSVRVISLATGVVENSSLTYSSSSHYSGSAAVYCYE